jgi:hypothetical protein
MLRPPACDRQSVRAMSLILALSQLCLITATWKLWFAQSGFPAVPMLSVIATLSVRRLAALAFVVMLVLSAIVTWVTSRRPQWRRVADCVDWLLLLFAVVPVSANQHTLQPWNWLFLLLTSLRLLLKDPLPAMRSALTAMYVCSAMSRVSDHAADGVGGVVVSELFRLAGGVTPFSPAALETGVWLLIGAEVIVGMQLLVPRTRRFGVVFAVLLHALLIVVLGPFGLNHHLAVLLWNLTLMILVPVTFGWRIRKSLAIDSETPPAGGGSQRGLLRTAWPAVAMVWLLPLSGLFGVFDNWPSWQVYSPRPERWLLSIHAEDKERLPRQYQQWLRRGEFFSDWQPLALDDWSLVATRAPLYPEDRFQLAVIRFVLDQCPADLRFQVQISEPMAFMWWQRRKRVVSSRAELDREARVFFLSSRAVP